MVPPRLKNSVGLSALILLIPVIISTFSTHPQDTGRYVDISAFTGLTIIVNILLTAVFSCLGKGVGVTVLTALIIGFHYFLYGYANSFMPFLYFALAASAFFGSRLSRDFNKLANREKIDAERLEERINILRDEADRYTHEISHLEKRLERYLNLNRITELFCSSFSLEEISTIITESSYELFPRSERALLFLIDTFNQELRLVHSKKAGNLPTIRFKKGDIYDRWVFWKKQPLIVEDINKDFRFSIEDGKTEKVFNSLISCPLISGEKVLGVIRMDSKTVRAYTVDDIRLLDIISDIAAVAVENCVLYKRLSDMAVTDGLTSLYVNKYFKELLANEVARSHKTGAIFSLIIFDIDGFKSYNDRYGHIAGDLVLKHISFILSKSLSGGEIAARYGGEEFAVLLHGKSRAEALKFAERLRTDIANTPITLRREQTHVTISIGISAFPEDSNLALDILRCADKRLYTAKEKGKNRVCAF